jgi:hypothetical protein
VNNSVSTKNQQKPGKSADFAPGKLKNGLREWCGNGAGMMRE